MIAVQRPGVQLRRAPARDHRKIAAIAREAVSWYAVFGGPIRRSRLPPACADHPHTVPRRHNGPRSEPRAGAITPAPRAVHGTTLLWDHPRHNGPCMEPRPAPDRAAHTGLSAYRACVPRRHHELSAYRACVSRRHHELPAPRAVVSLLHTGLRHAGGGTTRLHKARFATSTLRKGMTITLPRVPNGGVQLAASAP